MIDWRFKNQNICIIDFGNVLAIISIFMYIEDFILPISIICNETSQALFRIFRWLSWQLQCRKFFFFTISLSGSLSAFYGRFLVQILGHKIVFFVFGFWNKGLSGPIMVSDGCDSAQLRWINRQVNIASGQSIELSISEGPILAPDPPNQCRFHFFSASSVRNW